jgi:hypothetical protein
MRGFTRAGDEWQAIVEPQEARILVSLLAQLHALLAGGLEGDHDDDTALQRLVPDAYRDDPERAAEWRRLSRHGIVERKIGFARTIAAALSPVASADSAQPVQITAAQALDWVRAVGDLRLVIADRLGIVDEGDRPESREPGLIDLYDWLAWLQDDLVQVLEVSDRGTGDGLL